MTSGRSSTASAPRSLRSPSPRPLTQAFRGYVEQRNNENPEHGCGDHAAEPRRAHRLARDGPGPPRNNQGQQTKDERETGHHHRAESQARRFNDASADVLAEPP